MNILYFTLDDFVSLDNYYSINADLLREFVKNDHKVYVVSPTERRNGRKTYLVRKEKTFFLKPRIGNIQKTNVIEKGVSTISIEPILIAAIKNTFEMKDLTSFYIVRHPLHFVKQ